MYIVYFGTRKYSHLRKHSAWSTVNEANKQVKVLKDYGFKRCKVEYDETVQADNGHYYV